MLQIYVENKSIRSVITMAQLDADQQISLFQSFEQIHADPEIINKKMLKFCTEGQNLNRNE